MTETQLQIAVMAALHERGALAIHVPNEGARGGKGGAIAKRKGVIAGVPDVLCLDCMVAIELKQPGQTASKAQDLFLRTLRAYGWIVGVAHSVEEAVEIWERRAGK